MTKVLILKISSMGDVIHAFPAINDAKKNIQNLECHWVIEKSFQDIAKLSLDIDKLLVMDLRNWRKKLIHKATWQEIYSFLKLITKEKYDFIIDPQGLLKTAILAVIAHGPTYGYDRKSIREAFAANFYQNKISVDKNQHAIIRIKKLFAEVLNYHFSNQINYNLFNKEVDMPEKLPKNYRMFLHGTSRENKCWDEKKWLELAKIYEKQNIHCVVTYGNIVEKKRADELANNTENVICLSKCSLWQLAYVIRRADGVVGLDTGFTHLAAAYDVPMVSLYGPTKIDLIGAIGHNQKHASLYKVSPKEVHAILENLIEHKN